MENRIRSSFVRKQEKRRKRRKRRKEEENLEVKILQEVRVGFCLLMGLYNGVNG